MDAIIKLISDFDPAALLPDVTSTVGLLELLARIAVLAVPVVLLVQGLLCFFRPRKEASRTAGYRTYFGMGSVEAWRYTQWLAGLINGGLGLATTFVMLIISIVMGTMKTGALLELAAKCVLTELILTVIAMTVINVMVALRYDRDGRRRARRK